MRFERRLGGGLPERTRARGVQQRACLEPASLALLRPAARRRDGVGLRLPRASTGIAAWVHESDEEMQAELSGRGYAHR